MANPETTSKLHQEETKSRSSDDQRCRCRQKGTFRDWLKKDIEIMWIVAVALIPVLAVMIIESAQLLCVLIGLLYQLLNLVVQPVW